MPFQEIMREAAERRWRRREEEAAILRKQWDDYAGYLRRHRGEFPRMWRY